MPIIPSIALVVGSFAFVMTVVLTLIEVATMRTIREPERRTFTRIVLNSTQYQTIFLPTFGALVAGLFVSLAASYFYGSAKGSGDPFDAEVGVGAFVVGVAVLTATLSNALRKSGEPSELVRDPHSIAAAAREAAADPMRAVLSASFLATQLELWERTIVASSLDVSSKKRSDVLKLSLDRHAIPLSFWGSFVPSVSLYFRACWTYPLRLGWLSGGTVLLVLGLTWLVINRAAEEPDFWQNLGAWILVVFVIDALVVLPMIFYAWVRGTRARRSYQINRDALPRAWKAIADAKIATAQATRDEERLQRVLTRADRFFGEKQTSRGVHVRVLWQLGRLRLVLHPRTARARDGDRRTWLGGRSSGIQRRETATEPSARGTPRR